MPAGDALALLAELRREVPKLADPGRAGLPATGPGTGGLHASERRWPLVRLAFLRPLYSGPDWFASVYLEASRASEGAKKAVPLRWREVREELSRAGADQATLGALEETVTGRELAAPGAAAFGRSGRVALSARLPGQPPRQIARWSPLPHLMPLLVQSPPHPPHLLVSANRAGGEVVTVRMGEDLARAEVSASGWPVHKSPTGGWSQLEHQRAAEETWETNAKELAAAVAETASRAHPEAVVVAGDVRARGMLIGKLPQDLAEKTIEVDRELGADSAELAEAAGEALRAAAAGDARRRLAAFRDQLGTGRAAEGLAATVAALRDGQVAELLLASGDYLADDPESPAPEWASAQAWIGPGLADIGLSGDDLRERGVTELARDRADAAIVRAAAGTDAELFLVPADEPAPQEGIGALLRYAAPGA